MLRHTFPRLVLLILLASSAHVSEAGSLTKAEFAASVNIAGRQRMLAQRAAKEAFQIVLGIGVEKSRSSLEQTMGLFEQSLRGLRQGDASQSLPVPGPEVAKQVKALETAWRDMEAHLKEVLAGKPDVAKLGAADRVVTIEAQALVNILEGEYKANDAKLWGAVINLSGKQRMLSQKMPKEVYQILLNSDPETHRAALKLAVETFHRTLEGLRNGDVKLGLPPVADKTARAQIDAAAKIWEAFRPFMDKVVNKGDLTPEERQQMAEINLQLLEESDKVVSIFESLAQE